MLAIFNGVKAIMDELIPGGNLLIQCLSVLFEKTGKEQQTIINKQRMIIKV